VIARGSHGRLLCHRDSLREMSPVGEGSLSSRSAACAGRRPAMRFVGAVLWTWSDRVVRRRISTALATVCTSAEIMDYTANRVALDI